MTEPLAQHSTFTIDRVFDAPVARLYAAFANLEAKSRWFPGNPDWEQTERTFDFRVGGRERLKGRWKNGIVTEFDGLYHDIVPERRIVYSYDLRHTGRFLSVSLATLEFTAAGMHTRLKLTEQGVFLDGYDDAGKREQGTRELMDKLAASL